MAQLALGIVGSFFGPIGAQIGVVVGGVIDSFLFAGSANVSGPRLTDLTVSTNTYGQAIPLIYGPENRIAGNTIWSTGLLETVHTDHSGGKGGPSVEQTTYTYRESFAMAFSGREVSGVIKKIWMNSKLVFDYYDATSFIFPPTPEIGMLCDSNTGTHSAFDSIRFYQGNGTQQIDPTMESYLSVGNTPAYRHTVYMVIKDLQLADFGNVHPNIEVEFEADETVSIAEVVEDICERAAVGVVSTFTIDGTLNGYAIGRANSAYGAIQPLALAYSFDVTEQGGQIRFVKRGSGMKMVLGASNFGAAPPGGQRPDPTNFVRVNDNEIPRAVTVSFRDKSIDYQTNAQTASRQFGSAQNNQNVEIPLTLTPDEARRIADRILWGAWAGRRTMKSSSSDRVVRRSPGDLVGVSVLGNVLPFKIVRSSRGANAVIDWDLQYEDPEVYTSEAPGAFGVVPPNFVRFPGNTLLTLMDAPLLRPADDDTGFYWAANGPEDGWKGANILRSTDGTTYANLSQVGVRSVTGSVASPLLSGSTDFFDEVNAITVVLDRPSHTLESFSELDVLNGANAAWLGDPNGFEGEVFQFKTASLIAPATYELSGLLRGRRGTEYAIGLHGLNEKFVLLNTRTLGRSDFGAGDWSKQRLFKPVSLLQSVADVPPQSFTNSGEAKRPFSVVHVAGTRDGSNNLTITWIRRTRLYTPELGGGPVPLGEETEAYEIDVLIGSGSPALTLTATSETVTLTAAEQTSVGITPGDPVSVEIFQLSTIRGRGHGQLATI